MVDAGQILNARTYRCECDQREQKDQGPPKAKRDPGCEKSARECEGIGYDTIESDVLSRQK